VAVVMTEAEMNGTLTNWLVREHVAELRSQAARRYWRVERKRARAEIGTAASAVDAARGSAAVGHSTEAAYRRRAVAAVRRAPSA
jgi:hypothetical protein